MPPPLGLAFASEPTQDTRPSCLSHSTLSEARVSSEAEFSDNLVMRNALPPVLPEPFFAFRNCSWIFRGHWLSIQRGVSQHSPHSAGKGGEKFLQAK